MATKKPKPQKKVVKEKSDNEVLEAQLRQALSNYYDQAGQRKILRKIVGESTILDVQQLIAEAANELNNVSRLTERIESLSPIAKVALSLLAHKDLWPEHEWAQATAILCAHFEGFSAEQLQETLTTLYETWPLLRQNRWNGNGITLLAPVASSLRPLLPSPFVISHFKADARMPDAGVHRILVRILLFVGLIVQKKTRQTRNGDLYATDLNKLNQTFSDAAILYRVLRDLNLLEEVNSVLVPSMQRMRDVIKEPQKLFFTWLSYTFEEPCAALIHAVAQSPEHHAAQLSSALVTISAQPQPPYTFTFTRMSAWVLHKKSTVSPWVHIDLESDRVSIAPDVYAFLHNKEYSLHHASPKGYVQMNYEIVLSIETPLEMAWVLGCAAEMEHFESVVRLKITKQSVLAACGVGFTAKEILKALDDISAERGVPLPVRHAIEEWSSLAGQAKLRVGFLFQVEASNDLLKKVEAWAAPILIEKIAPQAFFLNREPTVRELNQLRDMGISLREFKLNNYAFSVHGGAFSGHEGVRTMNDLLHRTWPTQSATPIQKSIQSALSIKPPKLSTTHQPQRHIHIAQDFQNFVISLFEGPDQYKPSLSPLDELIEELLESLKQQWSHRADWLRQLDEVVESESFRTLVREIPEGIIDTLGDSRTIDAFLLKVASLKAQMHLQ